MVENKKATQEEIDLVDVAKLIWDRKLVIRNFLGVSLLLGLVLAFLMQKKYTATTSFVPQASNQIKVGGSLGGLASLAGINLGEASSGGSGDIQLNVYPELVNSFDFRMKLVNSKLYLSEIDDSVTYAGFYEDYYRESFLGSVLKYTLGLRSLLKKGNSEQEIDSKNSGFKTITPKQNSHVKRIGSQLSIDADSKLGVVTLSFEMTDPVLAAQMTESTRTLLQNELISYKIKNAQRQLEFTEARWVEKKKEFENIQEKLASFIDGNQSLNTASSRNELQRLQSENDLALNVYSQLSEQVEEAKLQVTKDTPIFSIIQSVIIPLEKSSPNRPFILFISIALGLFFSVIFILVKQFKFD